MKTPPKLLYAAPVLLFSTVCDKDNHQREPLALKKKLAPTQHISRHFAIQVCQVISNYVFKIRSVIAGVGCITPDIRVEKFELLWAVEQYQVNGGCNSDVYTNNVWLTDVVMICLRWIVLNRNDCFFSSGCIQYNNKPWAFFFYVLNLTKWHNSVAKDWKNSVRNKLFISLMQSFASFSKGSRATSSTVVSNSFSSQATS